jgi:Na+/H+ antiporter NhaA
MLDAAKIGILAASLLAAIAGMLLLRFSLRPLAAEPGS